MPGARPFGTGPLPRREQSGRPGSTDRAGGAGTGSCVRTIREFPVSDTRGPSMTAVAQQAGSAISPFHVEVPGESLADLRRRLAAMRWPTRELVDDRSQGVQLSTLQALARYWATEY